MTGDDETLLLLSAYCDGELSPGEVLAMERRLAAEPALRAMADRLRDLSANLRGTLPGLCELAQGGTAVGGPGSPKDVKAQREGGANLTKEPPASQRTNPMEVLENK